MTRYGSIAVLESGVLRVWIQNPAFSQIVVGIIEIQIDIRILHFTPHHHAKEQSYSVATFDVVWVASGGTAAGAMRACCSEWVSPAAPPNNRDRPQLVVALPSSMSYLRA